MLSRGLTSLLDSGKNKAIAAAGPAAAAAPAAGGAAGAAPMPSKQLHSQVLAGGCETAKHHGPEGRNDLQKHAAPRLETPWPWRTERLSKTRCPGAWRPFWILLKTKQLLLQASKTYPSPHRNTMALNDETTSKSIARTSSLEAGTSLLKSYWKSSPILLSCYPLSCYPARNRIQFLIHPMLTAAASSHALKTAPQRSPDSHTALPDGETSWPWRTNESENPTQKLSNVTSETLETEQKTCKKLAAAAATA